VHDIASLLEASREFRRKLQAIKAAKHDIAWYPYNSLANVAILERLLRGEFRDLSRLAGEEIIFDIGCGDGDLAFLLESAGYRVAAIYYELTSYNRMRGVRHVKAALGSQVAIHSVNLDSELSLPEGNAGLALMLGVPYHLKNPLGVLEELAPRARFCLLSTRIMQITPDRHFLQNIPVAYLLDRDELNRDDTNYWLFTETGLRRLLDRAQWEVLEFNVVGEQSFSDPRSLASDARAFCLARSRLRTDPGVGAGLLEGWHGVEEERWRWTRRQFSARLRRAAGCERAVVKLRFTIPAELGGVTLKARASGVQLAERAYGGAGEHLYRETIAGDAPEVRVDFEIDRSFQHPGDGRELGIAVSAIALDPAAAESVSQVTAETQNAHLEQRLLEYAAKLREAEQIIEDRSTWAVALQKEIEARGNELAECVELLHQAERTAEERTAWALNLQRELKETSDELVESNRLLAVAQQAGEDYRRRAEASEAALNASLWHRLKKRFARSN